MNENYGMYNQQYRRSYGHSNGGSFRKKLNVKKIVIAVAAILLMVALVAGIVSLFSTKTKTIHPSFSVGALDPADGKYAEATSSIYTKNAFECTGLIVKTANDAHIKYQIFFYDIPTRKDYWREMEGIKSGALPGSYKGKQLEEDHLYGLERLQLSLIRLWNGAPREWLKFLTRIVILLLYVGLFVLLAKSCGG